MRFNRRLSNTRVRVEHCIGILKARFQSLRELRIRVCNADDVQFCIKWLRCCCVLHNMLLSDEADDEWLDGDSMDTQDNATSTGQSESDGQDQSSYDRNRGKQKREELLRVVLGCPHGTT